MPAPRHPVASPQTVAGINAGSLQTLLGYNSRRVSLQAIALFTERMAGYGLSPVDFSVLSLIKHNPGITSRQLCTALNLLPPNMARKISAMEKRDLLLRRPHPHDGRAIGLYLMPDGRLMMQQAEKTATQLETDASCKLIVAEAKTLLKLSQKIYL